MNEMTRAQLSAEIEKCEYCERKPCRGACPVHCSPADFLMAARVGSGADFRRAAGMILSRNPLGGICGAVCPETHCMAECARLGFDRPVEIPRAQMTIVRRAARLGLTPEFTAADEGRDERIGVIGAGPAGLAAAFTLAQLGYSVDVFEREAQPGGACRLIPEHRLPRDVLAADLEFLLSSPRIRLHLGARVADPGELEDFDAVLVAVGLTEPIALSIPGEGAAVSGWEYLSRPADFALPGAVAVIGGGAVACDCAVTARLAGAERVEMFALEKLSEMPLAERERQDLLRHGVHVNGRTRVTAITTGTDSASILGLETLKIAYPEGDRPLLETPADPPPFDPAKVVDVPGSEQRREDIRHVIVAIGHRPSLPAGDGVLRAGDCETGPTTVVEAVAAGKNAAAQIHTLLVGGEYEPPPRPRKSTVTIPGFAAKPVSLASEFFGRPLRSPFLLSAAPPTDGHEQMRLAFRAGWAGGIMKTAFDDVPIHIPAEYMFTFGPRTWGNCDNVSGHSLDRVCGEISRLVREFPDRLVMASTGGPVTGDDAADAAVWRGNTSKLEAAGAMGIEYSLSCPQGGDGTEGDIVSQNAALSVKIIEWILETGDPNVPKLFKLTGAVTSIASILAAIREAFARYPRARAGVTLANTFPALGFRPASDGAWDEGVIVGLSGEGILPISNLSLAKVADLGVTVSGNGGPMDYKAAADFLALGAETVQFCTLVMKYGYGILDEIESGLSHLLEARGIASVGELVGIALPRPVTDFLELPSHKGISVCDTELCVRCGNCARCSYLAITLDENDHPVTDPAKCIGCAICAKKCISGALSLRERTPEELKALVES